MRLLDVLSLLAFCGIAVSAHVAVGVSSVEQATSKIKRLAAPKLERRVASHAQKRDEEQWIFGKYRATDGPCKDQDCYLTEPKINGRPYPYCQGFPGSNGYTENQDPRIDRATINRVGKTADHVGKDSEFPQWICFFYNDFDCDPSKGGGPGYHQWASINDKDFNNGNPDDREQYFSLKTNDQNQQLWYHIKAYGCMLYEDAPEKTGEDGAANGLMSGSLVEQIAAAKEIAAGNAANAGNVTLLIQI
ncbi:hypothetical protein N0V90_003976 [Kalmusia sp. IMI 367209]|nr:hypothetical protein N0V90_003976 [Kalmusia sp. IMI 367209]